MWPTPLAPPVVHFNMLYKQVTWLTKELKAIEHKNKYIRMELQNSIKRLSDLVNLDKNGIKFLKTGYRR